MNKKSTFLVIGFIVLFVFLSTVIFQRCKPGETNNDQKLLSNNEFVGDKSCYSCHKNEYHDWQQSHHYMAMLLPNDSSVVGDFNNVTFTADGITSHFFKKDGKYIINTEGDDGKNHDFEVKYTFGFTPLQQYLVEFSRGRMQVPRLSWDVKQKKWFNQYAGEKIPAHDWLHWTGNAQNWNTMCASCHSTNLKKNYDTNTDTYNTTFSSINVSCESCHGAGKSHIEYANSNNYKKGKKIAGSYIQLGKNSGQITQINTCTPCHARKSDISATPVQSAELLDDYIPEIPDKEHFFADGQVNDEDYIYTSFVQSKMFHRDVKCSNCHNPHSVKLKFPGNQTCLQCHAKTFDEPTHTFHKPGTEAAECKNCHMPGKIFMGNDLRHDHSFRVPRPDLSVKYGTPNACDNCHNNKTAKWLADAITKWYGPQRKYHFSEDLIPGSQLDEKSSIHLIKLLTDTSIPNIIKATAAKYLGEIPSQSGVAELVKCLESKDAHIRYRALRSLASFDYNSWRDAAAPLLKDKVRAVRIAAADIFCTIPKEQIPSAYLPAYSIARNELQNYLYYQADFSVGNVMAADYFLKIQDYQSAENFYIKGLAKDSLMNYARLNLSVVYNLQKKNDQAIQVLKTAALIDPNNDRIFYNMALIYNEVNNRLEAEKSFEEAVRLKSQNPKVYYNYGILLIENKKFSQSEKILQKGIVISPNSPELYYALTFLYIQQNNTVKANQAAMKLKQLDPNNPAYQQLFSKFGI